jgi:hypothetical protein
VNAKRSACDVFLAASQHDEGVAGVVRRAFEEAGLVVFSPTAMKPGSNFEDALREAIVESWAFVVLLTPSFVNSSTLALEYGGAWVWDKPIYILLESLSPKDVPSYLKRYKAVPIAKLAHVVKAVARSAKPLSERERNLLVSLYADLGVSPDQLAMQPDDLDTLTHDFNEATASPLSAERVLQEIVRLRKQGLLPRRRPRRRRPEPKA